MAYGIQIEPPGEFVDDPEKPGIVVGPMERETALAWAIDGDWAGNRDEALMMLVDLVDPNQLVGIDTESISPDGLIGIARDRYEEQGKGGDGNGNTLDDQGAAER